MLYEVITPMALAEISGGSGSGIADIDVLTTTAKVGAGTGQDSQDSATRAYIGDDSNITAGKVQLDADSNTRADASVGTGSGSGLASVAVTDVTVASAHDTEAFVGDSKLRLSSALEITANGRITSYNVCYTKLLRGSPVISAQSRSPGATAATPAGVPVSSTSPASRVKISEA